MKISFYEYVDKRDFEARQSLLEKLIMYNQGKKYGQVVFLAGGAGSGKGFAIDNFMQGENFKIRDVDALKLAFQKLSRYDKFTTQQLLDKYGDKLSDSDKALVKKEITDTGVKLSGLNLRNPTHVYILHTLVRATGAKNKTLDLILNNAKEGKLPNILFDTTFADVDDMITYIPMLMRVGYQPKDMHVTWVLTNYEIAIKNNAMRARVVPEDILLKTHRGAAKTIVQLVKSGFPKEINGGIYVVLNNPQNTMYIMDPKTGKEYRDIRGRKVVGNFTYLTVKKPGQSITTDANIKKQLYAWIKDNVPSDALDTKDLDDL